MEIVRQAGREEKGGIWGAGDTERARTGKREHKKKVLFYGRTGQRNTTLFPSLCNRLQQTATDCNRLQHIATDCNRLQQIVTKYNTLQQTFWIRRTS